MRNRIAWMILLVLVFPGMVLADDQEYFDEINQTFG